VREIVLRAHSAIVGDRKGVVVSFSRDRDGFVDFSVFVVDGDTFCEEYRDEVGRHRELERETDR